MGAAHGEERAGKQGGGNTGGGTGGQGEDGPQGPTGRQDRKTLGETNETLGSPCGRPRPRAGRPGDERTRKRDMQTQTQTWETRDLGETRGETRRGQLTSRTGQVGRGAGEMYDYYHYSKAGPNKHRARQSNTRATSSTNIRTKYHPS